MTVFLTMPQLAIVDRAMLFLVNKLGNEEVRSMFRKAGRGMSVGLAYTEQGQHFIARTTVPEFASDEAVEEACEQLISNLEVSYAKVMKRAPSWAA